MALVKMETGQSGPTGTIGGTTFYSSGGRSIARQRVSPIQPLTASVLDEVGAVVRGSREWAYRLSPSVKSAFDAASVLGLRGMPLEIAVWSWIWEVLEETPLPIFIPFEGVPVCPANVALVDDPASVVVELPAVPGVSGPAAWVAMSGPRAFGRRPRPEMTRLVGRGLGMPGRHDLTAAYVERFGRVPAAGSSVLVSVRWASLADEVVGGVCETVAVVSGGLSGSFTPNPITVQRLTSGTPSVLRMCSLAPGAGSWFVSWLGPSGVFFFHSNPLPNCLDDVGKVEATGAAGTYSGQLHGVNNGTGQVLDVPVTVIVTD